MDFIHITSYENSSFCKPNLEYYEEILEVIGRRPEQCIMIGNDVSDDMVSSKLGMETFLITNHIVNSYNLPVNSDHRGTYEDLYLFVKELPDLV
jgi:FMN phosphatase YigB (HAD superfamily)